MSFKKKFFLDFEKLKPYMAMIVYQFGLAGTNIVIKAATNGGMNSFVLGVYRHAIATLVMAPFAFLFERKKQPKVTLSFVCQIFVIAMVGPVIGQNLYYLGLKYTSPTYVMAMLTLVPAITFVMATILRMEEVKLREVRSQAKIVGTLICLGGAMILIFFKGHILHMIWTPSIHYKGNKKLTFAKSKDKDWIKGSLILLATCLCSTTFYLLQARVVRKYEAQLSITTLICLVGTLESVAVAFIFERDLSIWALGWNINLLTVVYTGVVSSGLAYYLQGFVMRLKGPIFATSFSPLTLIVLVFMGSIILGESIHLGSVLGGVVIVVGLYAVLWGKSKDNRISRETEAQLPDSQLHNLKVNNADIQGFQLKNNTEWSSNEKSHKSEPLRSTKETMTMAQEP